jgi:hypothetical protein
MAYLLRSVVTIIDVFYKYTKQDEECGTLSKDELKELLEKEFRPILKVCVKSEGYQDFKISSQISWNMHCPT